MVVKVVRKNYLSFWVEIAYQIFVSHTLPVNTMIKQECILVWCAPSAAVAVCPGGVCPGGVYAGGVCLGVSAPRGVHLPPVDRILLDTRLWKRYPSAKGMIKSYVFVTFVLLTTNLAVEVCIANLCKKQMFYCTSVIIENYYTKWHNLCHL